MSATYVLLIYRSPGASNAGIKPHRALQAETSSRRQLHAVAQLGDPAAAKSVSLREGAHTIADGPFIETKEWLVGFYLLDCADEAEALARAGALCNDGHSVEVRPVAWRWKA